MHFAKGISAHLQLHLEKRLLYCGGSCRRPVFEDDDGGGDSWQRNHVRHGGGQSKVSSLAQSSDLRIPTKMTLSLEDSDKNDVEPCES